MRISSGAVSRSSAFYDTSSSSARLSSSSTLPSSTDIDTADPSPLWKKRWRNKTFDDSRLSAASRLNRAADVQGSAARQTYAAEESLREVQDRNFQMETSEYTDRFNRSSFPKLDSTIDLGAPNLGDLFSSIGKRGSTHPESPTYKYMDPLVVKSVSHFRIVLTKPS